MSEVKIIHQQDYHESKLVHECWMLEGIPYRLGKELIKIGWTWITGPDGGTFYTTDSAVANHAINTGIPVINLQ